MTLSDNFLILFSSQFNLVFYHFLETVTNLRLLCTTYCRIEVFALLIFLLFWLFYHAFALNFLNYAPTKYIE